MLSPTALINAVFTVYGYLILARIVVSWIGVDYGQPWVQLLVRLTDPFLDPFRALIPPLGGIDFSPIIAFLVLNMLRSVAVRLLLGF
jgi:YggT family protein